MTTVARRIEQPGFELIESAIVTVATTIDIDGLQANLPHCFVGAQFFDSIDGDTPTTPGAGSVEVTVKTVNNEPNYEEVPGNTIDATAPDTVSWAANSKAVKLVPTGITTATHWRAVVTQNRT